MIIGEMSPSCKDGGPLGFRPDWEDRDMTNLAEAESKYGQLVQSAGAQIFGIERPALFGREGEKLKIGTPDGFVKIDVRLNQANIDLVLRETAVGIVERARKLRAPMHPTLGASSLPSARKQLA
jgi:hypothetical protein